MVKRILVIDDEKDILYSMKQILEGEGYKVKISNNGVDGLKLLDKENFDLVLLDLLMPAMSGKEVFERIRKNEKLENQKVALLTVVHLDKPFRNEIKDLNPVGYFEKPIDIRIFEKKIKEILEGDLKK